MEHTWRAYFFWICLLALHPLPDHIMLRAYLLIPCSYFYSSPGYLIISSIYCALYNHAYILPLLLGSSTYLGILIPHLRQRSDCMRYRLRRRVIPPAVTIPVALFSSNRIHEKVAKLNMVCALEYSPVSSFTTASAPPKYLVGVRSVALFALSRLVRFTYTGTALGRCTIKNAITGPWGISKNENSNQDGSATINNSFLCYGIILRLTTCHLPFLLADRNDEMEFSELGQLVPEVGGTFFLGSAAWSERDPRAQTDRAFHRKWKWKCEFGTLSHQLWSLLHLRRREAVYGIRACIDARIIKFLSI